MKTQRTLTYLMIISDTTIHYYESVRVMLFSNHFITSTKIYLEKFGDQCSVYVHVGVVYINLAKKFLPKLASVMRKYRPAKKGFTVYIHFSKFFFFNFAISFTQSQDLYAQHYSG